MSQILNALAAYVRGLPERNVHVVLGQGSSEDGPMMLAAAAPQQVTAKLVESSIDGREVGDPSAGRFAYFLDGIQRPRGPIYFGSVPVLYGYTAAAVRVRGEDRKMRKHSHLPSELFYFPYELLNPTGFCDAGIPTTDTGDDTQIEEHPLMLLERAKNKLGNHRSKIEANLISQWLAENDGSEQWLLVDGSLSGEYSRYDNPNIIGIIKSHQTQYFPWDEQQKILDLKAGERSGIFIPGGRKRAEVYSWYLRLRPTEGRDVYFGLVRVEAPKSDRTLKMADEISRWILAERSPLSMPDFRWDRMIYPIRDCEMYLKSLAPTQASLDAVLMSISK